MLLTLSDVLLILKKRDVTKHLDWHKELCVNLLRIYIDML